jgi:hypothetical protein
MRCARLLLICSLWVTPCFAADLSPCALPYDPNDLMTASGNRILKNGSEFIARGVIVRAFLVPQAQLKRCLESSEEGSDAHKLCTGFKAAREFYNGVGEFDGNRDSMCVALKNWNINSVRFNLNQTALDPSPSNPHFDPEYVKEVSEAVYRARKKGLVVFAALFDLGLEKAPNFMLKANPKSPMNNRSTLGAAKKLAKMFLNDRGVVIELLNEPYATPYRNFKEAWQVWVHGESSQFIKANAWGQMKFVGVNQILSEMRAIGSKHLIGLEALGSSFKEFPGGVVDPGIDSVKHVENIFYAAHPFLSQEDERERDWYTRFGEFSKTHPFVLTAFGVLAVNPWCRDWMIQDVKLKKTQCEARAAQYLQYLNDSKIGIFGFAIDVPNSMVKDLKGTARSFAVGFDEELQKHVVVGSAGELIQKLFTNSGFISQPNTAPVIQLGPVSKFAKAGEEFKFRIQAFDLQDDPMTYQISWGNEVQVDGANRVFSQRDYEKVFRVVYKNATKKPYKVIVRAFDSKGLSSEVSFELDVTK